MRALLMLLALAMTFVACQSIPATITDTSETPAASTSIAATPADKYSVIHDFSIKSPSVYSLGDFMVEYFVVDGGRSKSGVYNGKTGEVVASAEYYMIMPFHNGLAKVTISYGEGLGPWGYINTSGKVVVPLIYYETSGFVDGFAVVRSENWKWGIIDTNGEIIVPFEYDSASNIIGGLALAAIGKRPPVYPVDERKWGIVDTKNNIVMPIEYSQAEAAAMRNKMLDEMGYVPSAEGPAENKGWRNESYNNGNNRRILDPNGAVYTPPIRCDEAIVVGVDDGKVYIWVKRDGLWGIITVPDYTA